MREKAHRTREERLLDLLLPPLPAGRGVDESAASIREQAAADAREASRAAARRPARHSVVEIDVREKSFPSFEIIAGSSVEEVDINLKDMLPGLFQGKTRKRRVPVPEALEQLRQEEEQKLVDMDSVARAAVERVEQAGIIFIDEIDKIAGREGGHGPDVSREGVQRDILPIVEGTTVNTKYGMVRTDHILFIAAGAFHVSKPSDLIPELQGRFPIRVELEPLGRDEFVRILTEPKNALVRQYMALLETEGDRADVHAGRDRPHRRLRDARQRADREHRRPPPAHRDGEAARRDLVRGARSGRQGRDDRRSLRRPDARRHRQATKTCRGTSCEVVRTPNVNQTPPEHAHERWRCCARASSRVAAASRLSALHVGCGKKGPPLAPLVMAARGARDRSSARAARRHRRPAVDGARRRTPTARGRPTVERVDVYAVTWRPATVTPPIAICSSRRTSIGDVAVEAAARSGRRPSRRRPTKRPRPGDIDHVRRDAHAGDARPQGSASRRSRRGQSRRHAAGAGPARRRRAAAAGRPTVPTRLYVAWA